MNRLPFHSFLSGLKEKIFPFYKDINALKDKSQRLQTEIAGLQAELAQIKYFFSQESFLLRRYLLVQRGLLNERMPLFDSVPAKSLMPVLPLPLSECLRRLEKEVPVAYALWKELLQINKETYKGFPVHSCSVEGHGMAELFRFFIAPYRGGAVLDIGCGPQPIPSYLEGYPFPCIAGIDPLSSQEEHPFTFIQGVAEFLPWKENTFTTVIAATSLDHVLILEQVLKEVNRVLCAKGHFLIWISSIKNAPVYNPYAPCLKKADDYHVFHIDRGWFEEMLNKYFFIKESFDFTDPYNSLFYALRPKGKLSEERDGNDGLSRKTD